jgi:hypothetical protein
LSVARVTGLASLARAETVDARIGKLILNGLPLI